METTDGIEVRRAALADAPAVADVYLRSRKAAEPAIPPSVHDDDDVHDHFATLVLPEREVWVLDVAGTGIVGLLVLHDSWVDHLYLDPGWTGQGHGTGLLELAKRAPSGRSRPVGLPEQRRGSALLRATRLRRRADDRRRQRGGRAGRALPLAGTLSRLCE